MTNGESESVFEELSPFPGIHHLDSIRKKPQKSRIEEVSVELGSRSSTGQRRPTRRNRVCFKVSCAMSALGTRSIRFGIDIRSILIR